MTVSLSGFTIEHIVTLPPTIDAAARRRIDFAAAPHIGVILSHDVERDWLVSVIKLLSARR